MDTVFHPLPERISPIDKCLQKKISFLQWSPTGFYKPHIREDSMTSNRQSTQNKLNGIFVGFFPNMACLVTFLTLLFFCLYRMVSNFVFLWCVCMCLSVCVYCDFFAVVFDLGLLDFFYLLGCFLKRKKIWIWRGG